MHGFRDRFFRFMEGRYGLRGLSDNMQILLVAVYFLLALVNIFARSRIVGALETLILLYTLFRVFSKNILARENENRVVTAWGYKIRDAFRFREANAQRRKEQRAVNKEKRAVQKERRKDKEHIYRECPECGATLRLPRKKGKHSVLCPRCGNKFGVKC
ncbi:MAG: hypothetical protein ACI4LB_06435 [Candidatus Fimenecus sp.]